MEWLNNLLGVDAPADTVLESAELTFRGLFPWPLAVLLLLALAAGVVFLYWREASRVNPVMRGLMAVVRIALMVVLILLLFRPVLLSEFKGQRTRGVVVLLDNSKSMDQRDRRTTTADLERVAVFFPGDETKKPSRAELVEAAWKNTNLNLLSRLEKKGPLQPFLFGQEVHSIPRDWQDKKEPAAQTSRPGRC